MISPELFTQAEEARASTGFGRRNPNGNKLNNLFEKRTHCAHCGGILGVRNGRNESKAFFCRNKSEGRGCDTPNMNYDENMLLKSIDGRNTSKTQDMTLKEHRLLPRQSDLPEK